MMPYNGVTLKPIFHRMWITMEKWLVKWALDFDEIWGFWYPFFFYLPDFQIVQFLGLLIQNREENFAQTHLPNWEFYLL